MSKFYVGQRVRNLFDAENVPVGALGTVVGFGPGDDFVNGAWVEIPNCWYVSFDGIDSGYIGGAPAGCFARESREIEPIGDYDGNTVTTWASTVWKPKVIA